MSPLTNTVSLLLPFSCALQPISPWDLVSNYSGYRFYSNVIQPYDAFRVISRLHMTTLGSQFSSCCKCAFTHVCLSAPKFLYLVKYTFLTFIQLFFFYVSIFSRSLYYLMKCPISCFPTFKKTHLTSGYISLSPSCFLTIFMMWGLLHNSVFELRTEIKCNHKSRKSLSLTFKNYYVCNSSETSLTSCIENCLLHLSFLDISIKKCNVQ